MRVALLLRGVNVGGVTVRSDDLRALLEEAGLGDARTVLASGNAIVDADDPARAAAAAEVALEARYGRRVRVVGVALDELQRIVDAYPFVEDDEHTPYVVIELEDGVAARLADVETPEQTALDGRVVYWSNPKGTTTDSPFGTALVRIGRDATTSRNLRTLRRIIAKG